MTTRTHPTRTDGKDLVTMMTRKLPALLAALAAATALLIAPAAASASDYAGGIGDQYNKQMCASNGFERVKTPATEYAAVDSAGTCISSEKYHAAFTITSVTRNMAYQMPGISSGYVPTGESTCASAADTCYRYPVRQEYDGTPAASFGAWLAPGDYSLAFDTWFSPVESRHSYDDRAGDTEVMIWMSEPGGDWPQDFRYYTEIDGMRFGVMAWYQPANKVMYVAYVDQTGPGARRPDTATYGQHVSYSNIWLNEFWRDAIAHGWLGKSEWLWQVFLGYELRPGVRAGNGRGDDISNYNLKDMR